MALAGAGLLLWLAVPGRPQIADAGSETRAKELWELAIAAKGGRERLHAIRNMLVSHRFTYRVWLRKRTDVDYLLYVFPHKFWGYFDARGTVLGVNMRVEDLDRMVWYLAPPTTIGSVLAVEGQEEREDKEVTYREAQAGYLMESAWFQPKPLRASTATLEKRTVDLVHAVEGSEEMDYYFDRQTHLPVKMTYYFPARNQPGRKFWENDWYFLDYSTVDGIQVPVRETYVMRTSVGTNIASTSEIRFQFNVDYDPRIFEHPPHIEDGPQGWKKVQ